MKNNFLILAIILSLTSCKAQQIRPLENPINYAEEGIYYKDINNLLNPFVGT